MRFEVVPPRTDHHVFDVVYHQDGSLESVLRSGDQPFSYTSLVYNYVQLEVSPSGVIDHVWGFCPEEVWQPTEAEPPKTISGGVRAIPDSGLLPGVSMSGSAENLPTHFNRHSNWLCVGDPSATGDFRVEIVPSLLVVGVSTQILAVWLRIDRFEP